MTTPPPEWLTAYIDRKTEQTIGRLYATGAVMVSEETIRDVVRILIGDVINDMTIHLSHPQPKQEQP